MASAATSRSYHGNESATPFEALPPLSPTIATTSHKNSRRVLQIDTDAPSETATDRRAPPSTHYFVGLDGRLQKRRCWRLYTRLRRLAGIIVPCFKHDSNTFLCAPLLENTALNALLLLVRILAAYAVLTPLLESNSDPAAETAANECKDYTRNLFDVSSYTLVGIIVLCLPTISSPAFRLYRPRTDKKTSKNGQAVSRLRSADNAAMAAGVDLASEREDGDLLLEKTPLLRICEFVVVCEILYLMATFVILFTENSNTYVVGLYESCYLDANLDFGALLVVVIVQVLAVVAYFVRWRQIVLFHQFHLHLFYQRGALPNRARFDYIEKKLAFLPALFCGHKAALHSRKMHKIKVELYGAAKIGDVNQVRASVADAIALDGPDFAAKWYTPPRRPLLFASCRRNPLHVAVVFDQPEAVRELLEGPARFDPNTLDQLERIKLGLSWMYRVLFRVAALFNRGDFTTDRTTDEHTRPFGIAGLFHSTLLSPLHTAATLGNADMVLLLLRHGADANLAARSTDARFATPPLFWARTKDCARLLLDADANPLFIPGSGFLLTAFEVARLAGNRSVARLMEKFGGDVALTPLHDACARGHDTEVEFLLKHGANPDALGEQVVGFFNRTPLHWAAMRGQDAAIRLLLQYGASVDARDAFGRSPLAWACLLGRVSSAKLLLENGADPNTRDVLGDPLLCLCAAGVTRAAMTRASAKPSNRDDYSEPTDAEPHQYRSSLDPRVIELLVRHGVDLHATRTSNGDTALHVALRHGNETAALLLVRAGLDITAMNLLGQRAIECTTSTTLRYAVKKEAGQRDVMISYTHSNSSLARRIRDELEAAHVTTWIDAMDPTGIAGGTEWRREIANGIQSSALVLAVLTRDYPASPWCMKELAFARQHNVPVVAVQCDDMVIPEELQVYLWTRQMVDFRPALSIESSKLVGDGSEDAQGKAFRDCVRLLLDGIQDQIVERRARLADQHDVTGDDVEAIDGDKVGEVKDPQDFDVPALSAATTASLTSFLPSETYSPTDSTPFVFIAHGDSHASFCHRLRNALARQGVHSIIDEAALSSSGVNRDHVTNDTVLSAQTRQLAAKDAILASSAVIVVLSPVSTASGQLQDQLAFAEDRGKLVVPLMLSLHSVSLAQRYSLSRSVVHHFNESLGFTDSAERLATFLRAQADLERQQRRRRSSAATRLDIVPSASPSTSWSSSIDVIDTPSQFGHDPVDEIGASLTDPARFRLRRPASDESGHGWRLSSTAESEPSFARMRSLESLIDGRREREASSGN